MIRLLLLAATLASAGTSPGTVQGPPLTKGTQGATGFSVQQLKDAGRVNISWSATNVLSTATAEGLFTLQRSVDMAAGLNSVAYTITSGKRLRLTQLSIGIQASGTAPKPSRLRFAIRGAAGGSCAANSPIQEWAVAFSSGAVGNGSMLTRSYPDGLELGGQGDGTKQICFAVTTPDWVTGTNAALIDIDINGFEY